MEISQRIKDLRVDNDMTQKQVAQKLFMQVTQYRRYETGERTLPIDVAIALAKLYDVSLDYLACITPFNNSINYKNLTEEEKMLITTFRRLNERNHARIIERADTLIEEQAKK